MVVEGIRALLQSENSLEFMGSARNAAFCMAELLSKRPDIILMDINLPDKSGFELCKEVKLKYPGTKVIGLSTFNQQSFVKKMLESGADGYILKSADKKEILKAIEMVMRGQIYLDADVSGLLRHPEDREIILTKREKEILVLIAEGLTNSEIADRLFLGSSTVDTHRKHLLLKIGARNSAEMIKIAFQKNLLLLDS
ncbi:DNA-binding response regulator [Muriicola marianensis]|uniref:DNA-binding response regulator n=2 Tax=Muriicola marianensis TaxID=1324801 RepID=A0ABQ1R3G3_9FLAO|nr:DNA-binding response regulator [Muriicola marianensis]